MRNPAGKAIKSLRKEMGKTQVEFSEIVNKPQSSIARLESGYFQAKVSTLLDIAEATDTELKISFEKQV
ncbi:MAG: helix-turn-helix domain-containing protein [Streptococcaceae bacterium]|jgi:transcriptional regulator with XRE-family HTH domain|nr:helix-turn-helix domain-containing protein [Streptococcaceae bacterium]